MAYQTLVSYADSCKKSKFILFGYSQGSHIAGDLTNSIFNGNGPIGSDRLAASALLADPAFNRVIKEAGATGRSALYQYNGPAPSSSDFDPSDDTVFSTVGRGGMFVARSANARHTLRAHPCCPHASSEIPYVTSIP